MTIYMNGESESRFEEAKEAGYDYLYLESKAAIVQYYQDNYPARGKGSWKQELVKDLADLTGMKAKNLERRFDPSRLNNVPRTAREKDQYKELGKKLPPFKKPAWAGKQATVWITCWFWFSNKPYKKDFTRTLSEEQTAAMMEEGGVDAIIDAYGVNPDDMEELDIGTIEVTFS